MPRISTAWKARAINSPRAVRPAAAGGFTLIELMVSLAVIGLALSVMLTGSRTLLPQTRLRASAEELAASLERVRSYAVLRQEVILFAYDLAQGGYEAWLPYERDENGDSLGPGRTPVVDTTQLRPGVAFAKVRLPAGESRDTGVVTLEISALGRMVPHEIVVLNPDHPETEVYTVRVNGISNRATVLTGDLAMLARSDADFR
jgi:prepilin-type N-terminal cleavage/methylation domain-containing protein